jgi:hypothetical protein
MTDSKLPFGAIDPAGPPYNGDPTGERDSTDALQSAFKDGAATGRPVWMPGTWKHSAPLWIGAAQIAGGRQQ